MRISDWSSDVCSSDLYSEPTDAERALMKDLLVELERANAATDAALVRLEATEARAAAFDEDRYRAETTKRLEAAGIDWSAVAGLLGPRRDAARSEEHTSELQSLMRLSYAVLCLKKKQYKMITSTSFFY